MKWEWLSGMVQTGGEAWAQAPGGLIGGNGMGTIGAVLPFVLIFVLFYFLLLRPQQQRQSRQKQMLAALKKGDHVVTTGGMIGTVVALAKEVVTLQVAEKVRIKVLRDSITEVRGEDLEEASSERGGAA
ncbi:MAG TPA: preprotein translocase subunit YajC [Nitrospiria bacterium]|jgi:preprotein translocase subunit YajC|nr:preprotein translocase subunit YajC [Nitrospiria bacterium]